MFGAGKFPLPREIILIEHMFHELERAVTRLVTQPFEQIDNPIALSCQVDMLVSSVFICLDTAQSRMDEIRV